MRGGGIVTGFGNAMDLLGAEQDLQQKTFCDLLDFLSFQYSEFVIFKMFTVILFLILASLLAY